MTSHPEAPEAAQAIRLRGRARLRRTVASAAPESTREWIDRAREAYQRRENPDYAFCVDVLECVVDRMEFESSLFARLYLGLAYIGRSRPEEGMRELRLVVARGRARQPVARAHYALAVMLISEQRYTDALGHFEKLVAECPNSRYVRRSKKYIHKLKGASREAPALFEPQSK